MNLKTAGVERQGAGGSRVEGGGPGRQRISRQRAIWHHSTSQAHSSTESKLLTSVIAFSFLLTTPLSLSFG